MRFSGLAVLLSSILGAGLASGHTCLLQSCAQNALAFAYEVRRKVLLASKLWFRLTGLCFSTGTRSTLMVCFYGLTTTLPRRISCIIKEILPRPVYLR